MHVLHQLLVVVQLVGFAAALGGCLVQLRSPAPEVNLTMVYGAAVQLVAGLGLFAWDELGAASGTPGWAKAAVQLVLALAVLVLVVVNRRFADIPPGLLRVIAGLVLLNAVVAVLWT